MAKITFVLGLAGSGKSFYAQKLKEATRAEIFEGVVHNKSLPTIVQCLKDGKDCIVEEIAYCDSTTRENVVTHLRSQAPGADIAFVCFENDLASANWNLTQRTNKRDVRSHLAINNFWHSRYTCPKGAMVLPITRIRHDKSTA